MDAKSSGEGAECRVTRQGESVAVTFAGEWRLVKELPAASRAKEDIATPSLPSRLTFDARELRGWDSGLLIFLADLLAFCAENKIAVEHEGLPAGVRRLMTLVAAAPEHKAARGAAERESLLARVGGAGLESSRSMRATLDFIGEVTLSFLHLLRGKPRFRACDFWLALQECGAQALPIVSLISVLVGLILAFVGAIQLKLFGAQIYVANLVGIAMVRVMGAVMTGIIMAGQTGASYAAHIGTMQVNEEIDALETSGIPPVDFLVLPRVLALTLMLPLLTLYSDLLGILGGLIVGVVGLNLGVVEYYQATKTAVHLTNVWIGLFSGFSFGILVSLAGCLRGMQCGRSASAVGDATRSAVVTGIVSIIVATAVITVACSVLGLGF